MPRRIVCTPEICSGEPRIDGTRLTCADVVLALTLMEIPIETYLNTYPYLALDDIIACVDYCGGKTCIEDKPPNFCGGCVLDRREDVRPSEFLGGIRNIESHAEAEVHGGYTYLGTKEQYEEFEKPLEVWKLAGKLRQKLVSLKLRKGVTGHPKPAT